MSPLGLSPRVLTGIRAVTTRGRLLERGREELAEEMRLIAILCVPVPGGGDDAQARREIDAILEDGVRPLIADADDMDDVNLFMDVYRGTTWGLETQT